MYRALHLISIRQFSKAAELFIDALSTFTATELLDYKQFVEFTIISGVVSLNRVDLKKKVSSPPLRPCSCTDGPRSSLRQKLFNYCPNCPSSPT